ncbi:HNH endonuclease family protein [Streptomyces stelliscabiei]|uniref:HNH endonuclease family protein n=1 Tax=Streptomyces stelliscabiei TaxID=146820 RepID=UPI0029A4AB3C|nr:HNH endonuclease family protein [Streptomyces stelliscabiei]MDX2557204.1 HNH endonuclease family protein [Streptomyces stelliscabiei]MDX2616405.1 HNH endonuclease family protein [Streptomyces stelliscabiei]MDX2641106.1 HNH endonuclease family protein [Streptomyces stelliscabiei]MDX2665168.1 HNH endonuclease family protein [Streptomyces stelliscabiei]MDX2716156.1 HNH endonuclease family protein [Streptomyces stelliscabiei]
MRLPRAAVAAAAVASTLTVLLAPTTTTYAAESGDTVMLPVRDALQALSVQGENRTGYERTKFRHWVDADRDGCHTRTEVLLEEAVTAPAQDANCALTGGSWHSPYDDTVFTVARSLDIDHLIPLAESWDSGASAWTADERQAYANDLDDPRALIAVSATSNRSKADQDPATWQPPAEGYRCTYATDWITIKTRWGLTVDPAEQTALTEVLDGCPDTVIEVIRAR